MCKDNIQKVAQSAMEIAYIRALLERAANELQYTEEKGNDNPLAMEIYKFLEGGIQ